MADPNPAELKTRGSAYARREATRVRNIMVRRSLQITQRASSAAGLLEEVDRAAQYDAGGRLQPRAFERIRASAERFAGSSRSAFEQSIRRDVERSALDHAQSAADVARRAGYTPPPRADLNAAAQQVAQDEREAWGQTLSERLSRIESSLAEKVEERMRALDSQRSLTAEQRQAALLEFVRQITQTGLGQGTVRGGSVLKEWQRLAAAESGRKAYEAWVAALRVSGVQFAYRRLSAQHPDYTQVEICEVLASEVSSGIEEALRTAGYDPSTVDLEGLYPIDALPDYPHPFCLCWAEPLDAPPRSP